MEQLTPQADHREQRTKNRKQNTGSGAAAPDPVFVVLRIAILSPSVILFMVTKAEMYYVKKDTARLGGITEGFEL